MNNTSAFNFTLENATDSSKIVPSKAEGIALCSAFILTSVFSFVGNLHTVVLFAVNKRLRKKSLFLVINMAFADLMLGTVTLPIYIYADVGDHYQLWTGGWTTSLLLIFLFVNTTLSQASLISATFISGERFYAIYWPLKHKTLSMRAYRIVIFVVWSLALLIALLIAVNHAILNQHGKHLAYIWALYIFILLSIACGCNIAIYRKFQQGGVASKQQNRASQNKRLTKTLLFVSVLALLSWLPLVIMNFLIFACHVLMPWRFYYLSNVLNYSNSFVNPLAYALRIPEFKQAMTLCCLGGRAATSDENDRRRNNAVPATTLATELRTLQADQSHTNLAFEQEVMDTKL